MHPITQPRHVVQCQTRRLDRLQHTHLGIGHAESPIALLQRRVRAIEDQRLMDQVYASIEPVP